MSFFTRTNSLTYKFKALLSFSIAALLITLYGMRLMSKATEFSYQERQHILSLEKISNELMRVEIDRQSLLSKVTIAIEAANKVDSETFYFEKLLFRALGRGWLIDDARESSRRLSEGKNLLKNSSTQYLTSGEGEQFNDHVKWSLDASAKFGEGVRALSFFIKKLVTVMIIVSISVVIFIVYIISIRSLPPLAILVKRLEQISNGQLDITVEVNENYDSELVSLQKSAVKVVQNLRILIADISHAIDNISLVSSESVELTTHTLEGIKIQKTETELLSLSISEMSLAINEVASSASSAALEASKSDASAREGQEVVAFAVSSIRELSSELESSVKTIERIEEGNNQIVSVVKIIKDITDQTNLLALNAAIEAAHAGEFGRGFSVVADQVRVLAEQTEKSAMDIQQMVEELRRATTAAVVVMNISRKKASESVEETSKAGSVITGIANSISTITTMNEQIASAAEQQSVVTDGISGNARKISQIASEGEANAEKVSSSKIKLVSLSNNLKKSITAFTI